MSWRKYWSQTPAPPDPGEALALTKRTQQFNCKVRNAAIHAHGCKTSTDKCLPCWHISMCSAANKVIPSQIIIVSSEIKCFGSVDNMQIAQFYWALCAHHNKTKIFKWRTQSEWGLALMSSGAPAHLEGRMQCTTNSTVEYDEAMDAYASSHAVCAERDS